ncbi:ATP-binding protein [Falsiroseomonas selenitidurans]|uniref:histidine kinase n=1 Tax=Falsiroseomonas selenitidurans TaxID=2716335 RepID=A0ABX1ED89_9PROT|nr:hybrid sensor histidine kinase/response regulator [Falsiroseomonas selenitidurans]NKC33728.1 PAS domain-containing protein [Falsiroseomonas selenitidurans]
MRRVGGFWLALSLMAFALIAAWLFLAATLADRQATLDQGWTDAENAAALLAQHADRMLRIAELTTERAADGLGQAPLESLRGEGWARFAGLEEATPEVQVIWVVDAEGQLVATSRDRRAAGLSLSAAPYFMPLRDGRRSHLSGLMQGGPAPGWHVAWGRPLFGADGRFRAAILAAVAADELAQVAAGVDLGPGVVLQLDRIDGSPVMRWPAEAPDIAGSRPRRAARGTREVVDEAGVARLVAWRAAPGMPVLASAALSREQVLAPYRQRLLRNGLIFALSAALGGLLGAAALRAERRERAARRSAEERGTALAAALAEREDLLASVQEGEARLRLAQQAGRVGLWDWDLREGRLALVGEVFSDWGLRTRRRITARAALRGVMAEDRLALAAALTAAVRGEAPLEAEFRLAHASPERWIGVRAEVRRGVDGQPRRMLGIARDVTDRRQQAQALAEANATLERRVAERTGALADANARLREGEARFRGIFDATFQFIGLLSPDGTLLEANEAMLRLGGVQAEDVVGRPYWAAPWWPEEAALRATVREAVASAAAGHFVRRELTMRGRDGGTLAIDFSIKPVRDEDGLVSLLVPEARDVSALKAAQAQLLEAQKMEVLGRLTGGVAHDFNNLLMTVLGNLGLARKRLGEAATPQILRHLDAATLGAERGAQLTQRLLAFARRQDLNPRAVDLARLLAGLTELLGRSAGPRVRLAIAAQPGLPAAMVDPHALELALMNLVVNARDAMPEGGEIAIRLDAPPPEDTPPGLPPGLPPGRTLRIAVADTGLGMDAATLARAVEPFFSTKGPGQGTGLGLSMVHGLAHQSGGALHIASAPGAGTTCTLWLPAAAAAAAEDEAGREAEAPRGSGCVLLVDDEPLVLESTAAMLADLGYEVLRAESADAALAALAAGAAPFAVVTDHAMPGMTGAELAARLARDRPGLPVILATGHAGPWPEGEGPPRLAKPYSQAMLARALAGLRRAPAGGA